MSINDEDALLDDDLNTDDEELEGFGLTDEEEVVSDNDEDSSSFNYNAEE